MTKYDYELFRKICQFKQRRLLKYLNKLIHPLKYDCHLTKDYLYAQGTLPILLIAHVDTVFKAPPMHIYYDKEQNIIWSPEGLGADDRAGVFAIIKILQSHLHPSILFTTDEEIGGLGAQAFIDDYPEPPIEFKYIIQLDRQGYTDCVFYNCDNPKFTKYIENFGFHTEWGTFTDISHICPVWRIAGVNLSVGYKNEHSVSETLQTAALETTIEKVKQMLEVCNSATYFKYIPGYGEDYFLMGGNIYDYPINSSYYVTCGYCNKYKPIDSVFPVIQHDRKVKYMCIDCIDKEEDKITWCTNCQNAFELVSPDDEYCANCQGITTLNNTSATTLKDNK